MRPYNCRAFSIWHSCMLSIDVQLRDATDKPSEMDRVSDQSVPGVAYFYRLCISVLMSPDSSNKAARSRAKQHNKNVSRGHKNAFTV